MNLLLHVTDLDSFQWYKRIESMTKEEMIGRLLRTEPPKIQMRMGTAWHGVLEDPPDEFDIIIRDGCAFKIECDATIILPQVREVRAKRVYKANGINVTLTGKCDGITALKVSDHKLTFNPNPENYIDSFQWKAYLDIFNARVFEYIIYHGYTNNDKDITIKDVSTMKLYRYPGMKDDINLGIIDLVDFIKANVPQMIKAA